MQFLPAAPAPLRLELAEEERVLQAETAQANIMMVSGNENNEIAEAAESAEYGFLNHMNRSMLAEASIGFQAVWGDRPLDDNWRRREAVSGSRYDQILTQDPDTDEVLQNGMDGLPPDVGPDLTAIPFNEEEQIAMQREIEEYKYRLANLFLFRLDMPDSARIYFEDILQSGLNESLMPRTLFSLIDLELAEGDEADARDFADRLLKEYPESPYTSRVIDRLDIERMQSISYALAQNDVGIESSYQSVQQADTAHSAAEQARLIQSLAQKSRSPAQTEILYYEAARHYMKAAIAESEDTDSLYSQISDKLLNEQQQRELIISRDSSAIILEGENLTEREREKWGAIADTTLSTQKDTPYPFHGAYWDSTRSMLNEAGSLNRNGRIASKIRDLQALLKKPETSDEDTVRSMDFPRDRFPTDPGPDMNRCLEAGLVPDIEDGIPGFMSRVQFPDWAYGSGLNTEITYRIEVASDGEVTDYEQVTTIDRSGIPQAVEEAMERELRFEPLKGTDSYRCDITFPIEL